MSEWQGIDFNGIEFSNSSPSGEARSELDLDISEFETESVNDFADTVGFGSLDDRADPFSDREPVALKGLLNLH